MLELYFANADFRLWLFMLLSLACYKEQLLLTLIYQFVASPHTRCIYSLKSARISFHLLITDYASLLLLKC